MIPLGDSPVGPVYDVVFVVEMTANLATYINTLKTSYILPTLEHFNGAPPDPTDYGNDFSSTLYDLVTFHSGDIAPSPASNCTYPTTSIHKFIKWLDDAEFIGGESQRFSHISEGLGTALQVFDHIKQCRNPGISTQRHCILVCNSPPYHLPCQESHDYSGYTSDQLATMLGKRGIHLSIISPKKIPALQKLFEEAYPQEKPFTQKDFTTDPRHMVVLHGYQLQERSHTPTLEEEKQTSEIIKPSMATPAVARTHSPAPPGSCDGQFKVPGPTTSVVSNQPNLASIPQHPSPQQLSPLNPQSQPPNQASQPSQPVPAASQPSPGTMQPPIAQVRPVMQPGLAIQTPNPVTSVSGGMTVNTSTSLRTGLPIQGLNKQEPAAAVQQRPGQGAMLTNQRMANPVSVMSPQNQIISQPAMISGQTPNLTTQQQAGMTPQQQNLIAQNQAMQIRINQPNLPTSQPMVIQTDIQPNRATQPAMSTGQPGIASTQVFLPNPSTQPQGIGGPGPTSAGNPVGMVGAGDAVSDASGQKEGMGMQLQGKKIIWRGMLEYQDKTKAQGPNPLPQKSTKTLSCCVSVNATSQDFNARNWPEKLIMQLMPQDMLNSLSALFRNSRTVSFHFQQTDMEALRNLYRIMGTGFAGCVHFPQPSQCEVRVLLLLFSNKKKAFLGLIPNDQSAFVQGIKHVLTQHRTIRGITQATTVSQPLQTPPQNLQTQGTGPMQTNPMTSTSNIGMMTSQVPCTMPMTSNTIQQPVATMPVGQDQQQQAGNVPGIMVNQGGNMIGNPQLSQNERFDLQRKIQNLEQTLQMAKQKELQFQQVEQLQARNAMAQRQQQQQQMMEEVYFPGPPPPSHMYAAQQQQRQQLLQQQRLQMQQGVQQQQQQQQQLQQLLQVQGGTPAQQPGQQQIRQQIMVQPQQQSQHTLQPSQQPGMMTTTTRQGMPMQQQGQTFIDDFTFQDLI